MMRCLARHFNGDWGELGEADQLQNEQALDQGYRLFSSYEIPQHLLNDPDLPEKLWIITEADRSATTLLFPSDY